MDVEKATKRMAPDFWCSGVLDTIKNFLAEDKFEVGFSRT